MTETSWLIGECIRLLYGRFLTIIGPSNLVRPSGSFFQILIISSNFGFIGLRLGSSRDRTRKNLYGSGRAVIPQPRLNSKAPVPSLLRPKSKLVEPRAAAAR